MNEPQRRKIETELAAISPGSWVVGVESENGAEGSYWEPRMVYAVSDLPENGLLPDFTWTETDEGEDEEADYQRVASWADEHQLGNIAELGNYFPIPDVQHDANARFIAHAPKAIRDLLDENRKMREALELIAVHRCNKMEHRFGDEPCSFHFPHKIARKALDGE